MSSEEKRKELYDSIDKLLGCGVVNRHSYFQLKYFVIGKEPTLQSKMWRCVRELQARKESLDALQMEMEDTRDNIELVDIEMSQLIPIHSGEFGIEDPIRVEIQAKTINIQKRKCERRKKSLERSLISLDKKRAEIEEEAIYFLRTFESLQKVEPLKPYDDLQEQTKYWNEKITQQANLKVLLHLPLDTELVQTALSLSDDCAIKKEMVKLLEHERLAIEHKKETP